MANTYKNIVITPNRTSNAAVVPTMQFSGGDTTSNTDIYLRVYTTANGTLSFDGSAGQLFSISNDLANTLFSVNDISGLPVMEADANGLITMAITYGNVAIGRTTAGYKLDVVGTINASAVLVNGSPITGGSGGGGAFFKGNNGDVGSGTGLGDIFRVHTNTLTANVTIPSGNNALAAGPITIALGKVLTIQSNARVSIV